MSAEFHEWLNQLSERLKSSIPEPLPDSRAKKEEELFGENPNAYDIEQQKEEMRRRIQARKIEKDEHELRKDFAYRIFELICYWIGFVAMLTFADALFTFSAIAGKILPLGVPITDIFLSDALLMFMWGTATATIVGLFVYVAKYLFPDKK